MILFVLAAQFVAAQGEYVIYEGTQLNYRVNFNDGNNYTWEILKGTNPPVGSNVGDYDFITDSGFSEVGIQWNIAGLYFLTVTESDALGCSNKKAMAVQVEPNNRFSKFEITASTECFNVEGNSYSLPFNVLDNNSQPLSTSYFPIVVEFSVNGTNQSQKVSFSNQLLQISEEWFTANPIQNTDVIVEITNVTDKFNAPVKPGIENGTHMRTLFAIPEIEFTEELRIRYKLYEEITAYITSSSDHVWRMEPK
ncbi:MAG: hypothetical protein HQ521_11325 [Bacteroidetes bacterium]|nr:hypothetical protein [Bacteroidota bacterium]